MNGFTGPDLGTIPAVGDRDAIHVAVIPVEAGERLLVGQHVRIVDGRAWGTPAVSADAVGIVDPFLRRQDVARGVSFYLLLYPGTITSLRHEWSHPMFKLARDMSKSERWLRDFARENRASYEDMIKGAASGDGAHFGDDDGPEEARTATFWSHVEVVTGRIYDDNHRQNTMFTCAC